MTSLAFKSAPSSTNRSTVSKNPHPDIDAAINHECTRGQRSIRPGQCQRHLPQCMEYDRTSGDSGYSLLTCGSSKDGALILEGGRALDGDCISGSPVLRAMQSIIMSNDCYASAKDRPPLHLSPITI